LINNKLYQAIVEINTKGTFQDQAKKLYEDEKLYKKVLAIIKEEKQACYDEELLEDIEKSEYKYKTRLENVRNQMCYLNKRIIDALNIIEEFVDVEVFVELFGLDYDEWDEEENFYVNLLTSSTVVGHICRQGIIQNEKLLKEFMED